MEYRTLGRTNVKVSVLCLGSMTWGEQNTEADAHEQLDYAVGEGINFLDTANSIRRRRNRARKAGPKKLSAAGSPPVKAVTSSCWQRRSSAPTNRPISAAARSAVCIGSTYLPRWKAASSACALTISTFTRPIGRIGRFSYSAD